MYIIFRSEEYLKFIRRQNCLVCGASPCDPHHENHELGGGGIAIKPSDSQAVPLCRECHVERHSIGAKTFWERHYWIDYKKEIINFLTEFMENCIVS